MRFVFFDSMGRLRNGWWALAFVALLVPMMIGQLWLQTLLRYFGLPKGGWQLGLVTLATLGCTWICTRLRREPLTSIGFRFDRLWIKDLGLGAVLGGGQMLAAVAMIWMLGGVGIGFNHDWNLLALGSGSLLFVVVALQEEVLFRGFLFQRLHDGLGAWPSLIVLAVLFAVAHEDNPGMEAATQTVATMDLALGGIVLGLAYIRTRSLALPIGIHFGWNWMQGAILGFAVSGTNAGGVLHPTLLEKPEWLTGGAFGIEASVFSVVVDAVLLIVLLCWKPHSAAPAPEADVALDTSSRNNPRRHSSNAASIKSWSSGPTMPECSRHGANGS